MASEKIVSKTPFGSSNAYKHSTIAGVAATYESEQLSETAKEYCLDVTVNNVTAKVFIPNYAQVNGGFSYYNSNANRICQLNGANAWWWTSSPVSSNVYLVSTDGSIYDGPGNSNGFRPHICIKYYPIGFDFTYTGTCNIRTDGVIEFLTSGDFIPNETLNIDAFLVGGGAVIQKLLQKLFYSKAQDIRLLLVPVVLIVLRVHHISVLGEATQLPSVLL